MEMGRKSFDYNSVYPDLVGTKYEGKTPDLKGTNGYIEVKGYKEGTPGKNALRNMLGDALSQASRVVLQRHPEWTDNFVLKSIHNRVKKQC